MHLRRPPGANRALYVTALLALGAVVVVSGCQFIAAVDRSRLAKPFDDEATEDELPPPIDLPETGATDAGADATDAGPDSSDASDGSDGSDASEASDAATDAESGADM
jgi:hypothetical protein